MFELNQLRYFIAVATELNFRRAAERLNMTQPPLSRQIQLLEHQLGIRLLERTKRSVRLTPAGRAFFPEAESLLQRAQVVALSARRVGLGDAGSVAIGFVAAATYNLLPRAVVAARAELPGIDLILKEMNTFEGLEALATRRIDIGIVRPVVERRELESCCVVREPFVVALPSQHALSKRRLVTLSALDGESMIMYSPSGWQPFYEMLAGSFRSAGVAPRYIQFLTSTQTILALVNAGVGVALVPASASRMHFDNVTYRRINLDPGVHAELHLVWRKENDNPALTPIRELLIRASQAKT